MKIPPMKATALKRPSASPNGILKKRPSAAPEAAPKPKKAKSVSRLASKKAKPVIRLEATRNQYIAWTGIRGAGQYKAFTFTKKTKVAQFRAAQKWLRNS